MYIMTDKRHTTFYFGVTSDLPQRVLQHRNKEFPNSFSARYNLSKCVNFQAFATIDEAILFKKHLKGKGRKYKVALIDDQNPEWKELGKALLDRD